MNQQNTGYEKTIIYKNPPTHALVVNAKSHELTPKICFSVPLPKTH